MSHRRELEIIDYTSLSDVKTFLVDIHHRNMHMHKEFELFEVLEGRMEINCQNATHLVGEGGLVLLNPRQPHEMHSVLHSPVRIMPLQVSPNFFARHFPQLSNVEFDLVVIHEALGPDLQELRARYLRACEAYLMREPYFELVSCAQVNLIMRLLLNRLPWHYLTEKEKAAKKGLNSRVSRIIAYIEEHYTQKLLLKDICEREQLSLAYLSRYFSEHFNMSFQDYLTLLRFHRAKLLAERTDMKLTDIALSSGFSDIRYLNRAFEQHLQCSVHDYRRQLSGQPLRPLHESKDAVQRFLSEEETRAFFVHTGRPSRQFDRMTK